MTTTTDSPTAKSGPGRGRRAAPVGETGAAVTGDEPAGIDVAPSVPAVAAILEQVDRNADDWWRSCALAGIRHLAATGRPFTAADVAALGVPEPDHRNRWGGVFSAAARAEIIRPVAIVRGYRRTSHGAFVRLWVGADHGTGSFEVGA